MAYALLGPFDPASYKLHLAEIFTKDQNDFLKKLSKDSGGGGRNWIGGHDLVVEGQWFWATSEVQIISKFVLCHVLVRLDSRAFCHVVGVCS